MSSREAQADAVFEELIALLRDGNDDALTDWLLAVHDDRVFRETFSNDAIQQQTVPAPAMQPANEPTVMIAASEILDRMDRRIERQRGVQRFYRER